MLMSVMFLVVVLNSVKLCYSSVIVLCINLGGVLCWFCVCLLSSRLVCVRKCFSLGVLFVCSVCVYVVVSC